jgi:hypothetical protein
VVTDEQNDDLRKIMMVKYDLRIVGCAKQANYIYSIL